MQLVKPLPMYDPALHPELMHTTCSSPEAALHPDCSGKSTLITLPCMDITVPTLEYVASPQPCFGADTDGFTWTRLPTTRGCEHSDDDEGVVQVVAPAVHHGQEAQSAKDVRMRD